MEDIKPREVAWRFDGRDWVLRCNNNVLAEVQIVNGGNFGPVLSRKRTLKSVLQLLAAMLNDYADEQKWVDEKGFAITYTEKQLGRRLSYDTVDRLAPDIMRMTILAVNETDDEKKRRPWKRRRRYQLRMVPEYLGKCAKNDETVFWRRMTPARCMAIYREYFSVATPSRCAHNAPEQPARLSLAQYLMGGGG